MAGKRSSEYITMAMLFLLLIYNINAETYMVGDELGWTNVVSMQEWPENKTFYVGDVLEFKYEDIYSLWKTDETGFTDCSVNDNSTNYNTGDDKIALPYGSNYFMCGNPYECQAGMKIAVFAHSLPPL